MAELGAKSAIQQVHVVQPLARVSLLGDDARPLGLMRQLDAVAEQVLVVADAAGEDRLRDLVWQPLPEFGERVRMAPVPLGAAA